MPIYDYDCSGCNYVQTRILHLDRRDKQTCNVCGAPLKRRLSAPIFRFKGVPTKGGGPDKFTADVLGIPLKELPEGFKTK